MFGCTCWFVIRKLYNNIHCLYYKTKKWHFDFLYKNKTDWSPGIPTEVCWPFTPSHIPTRSLLTFYTLPHTYRSLLTFYTLPHTYEEYVDPPTYLRGVCGPSHIPTRSMWTLLHTYEEYVDPPTYLRGVCGPSHIPMRSMWERVVYDLALFTYMYHVIILISFKLRI
jgi:hypothetical protein